MSVLTQESTPHYGNKTTVGVVGEGGRDCQIGSGPAFVRALISNSAEYLPNGTIVKLATTGRVIRPNLELLVSGEDRGMDSRMLISSLWLNLFYESYIGMMGTVDYRNAEEVVTSYIERYHNRYHFRFDATRRQRLGAMHELKKLAFLDSIREISKWIFNQEMTPLELALQFHPYDMVHGISATLPDVSTPLLAPHRIQDGINGSTRAVRVKLYPEDVVNMRLLAQGVGPDFAVRFLPDQFLEDGFLKSSAYKQQRYRIDCPFF